MTKIEFSIQISEYNYIIYLLSLLCHMSSIVAVIFAAVIFAVINYSTITRSVRTIQRKLDRSDPVLIILCSSVVQYRSSTAHAESAERPVC